MVDSVETGADDEAEEETMFDRRQALMVVGAALARPTGAAASGGADRAAANQWYPVVGDDGHPVPNLRLPVELVSEIEDLPGAVWGGGGAVPTVTLVSFYDFNCPWCRASVRDLGGLMGAHPDLRIGLVNNPILSPASAQAAKVELALLKLAGASAAHGFYERVFATPGRIDGSRALDAAAGLGHDRAEVERAADGREVADTLGRQMRLAASLGLVATPSYVIGGAALLGYPGPKALDTVVSDTRACGSIAC